MWSGTLGAEIREFIARLSLALQEEQFTVCYLTSEELVSQRMTSAKGPPHDFLP